MDMQTWFANISSFLVTKKGNEKTQSLNFSIFYLEMLIKLKMDERIILF
jgi:hypothetical protein